MRKFRFKKIYILFFALTFTACNDYLDSNEDPNRPRTTTLSALLAGTIESTAYNHYLIEFYTGQFSQHLASYFVAGSDSYFETRIPSGWTGIYLSALTNLDLLSKQAHEEGAPLYEGIAKILQAVNLGLATDCWGDIPFSTAFQAPDDLTPSFDSQDQIYTTINKLLDDGIELLKQSTPPFKPVPSTDDLIYGGGSTGIARWIKTAYAMKARYAIHLSKLNPSEATANALAALSLAMSSNSDDFQLNYSTTSRNPWFNNVSSPITTKNFTVGPSSTIINLMNGTRYPGPIDPRLSKMFDLNGSTTYAGLLNGKGSGGTSLLSINTFYLGQTSPLPMITYAEMKFIEAEALFLANGGTTTSIGTTQAAYNAYLAGITAHMQKLGIDATSINNYKANAAAVAPNAASLTLQLIMKEKYIALFLNPENWTDVRRYDYSNSIYRGMQLPANYNTALGGEFIRRVLYPFDEINRNGEEVTPHIKPMQERMWWN